MSGGRRWFSSGIAIVIAVAVARLALETYANNQYGFHRDELATLDDARHLAWGYVAYPPLTPFLGRMAMEIFGLSLRGIRFFAALAQAIAMVLAAMMARDLGAGRWGRIIAGLAAGVAPVSLAAGVLFQYVSFDYLWWVAGAFFAVRLIRTENPRWWLGVGTVTGLGLLTKYTIILFAAALLTGFLLTESRRFLASRWLLIGAALACLIALPNAVWQTQHNFVSLDFLESIHARDVRIGRTSGFLPEQLFVPANPLTIPLWIAGLAFYFVSERGKRFRALGWTFLMTLALFVAAKGRSYYMAPAYPMLLAAGSVLWEQSVDSRPPVARRIRRGLACAALAVAAAFAIAFTVPLAPVNSPWWTTAVRITDDWREEVGWPELVDTTAAIWNALPAEQRARTGILAANYGEAGAIDLFGAAYGLPQVISGINSYWFRTYPDPPPDAVIVLGFSRTFVEAHFESCVVAARPWNRFGIHNEETSHAEIFRCGRLRQPWPEWWKKFRYYG